MGSIYEIVNLIDGKSEIRDRKLEIENPNTSLEFPQNVIKK